MRWAKKAKTHGLRLLRRQRPTVAEGWRIADSVNPSDARRGKAPPLRVSHRGRPPSALAS